MFIKSCTTSMNHYRCHNSKNTHFQNVANSVPICLNDQPIEDEDEYEDEDEDEDEDALRAKPISSM